MSENPSRSWMSELSPRQRKIVSYGITSIAICAIALLVTLMVFLGSKVITILSPAISPLVLGLLLSLVLRRFLEIFPEKIRSVAYWAMWLVIAIVIGVTMWGWGEKLMGQVDTLAEIVQKAFSSVMERLSKIMKRFPQIEKWSSEVQISAFITQFVMFFVSGFKKISTWGFAIFFGYCFLKRPLNVDELITKAKEVPFLSFSDKTWNLLQAQLKGLVDMLTKYFPKQLGFNVIEGLIGAIGLMMIGLLPGKEAFPSGIVLGFLMGFMNIIPLFGTVAMLPIVLTVGWFCNGPEGSPVHLVWALVVWGVIELFDIFVIPAWHAGVHGEEKKEKEINTGVIVFSFLFWGALIDPVWGMILAIPLTAFSISFCRAFKEFLKNNNDNTAGNSNKERKA